MKVEDQETLIKNVRIRRNGKDIKQTQLIEEISPDLPYQKILYLINDQVDVLSSKHSLNNDDVKNLKDFATIILNAKKEEREDLKHLDKVHKELE